MGCCQSREISNFDPSEHPAKEIIRGQSGLKVVKKDAEILRGRLGLLQGETGKMQTAVGHRSALHRVVGLLEGIEESVQAQFVSERLSTNLIEEELLETIRRRNVQKCENLLQIWKSDAEFHTSESLSLSKLQTIQVSIHSISLESKDNLFKLKKQREFVKKQAENAKSGDWLGYNSLEEEVKSMCDSLVADCESLHRQVSALIVRIQSSLSDSELKNVSTEVERLLSLLQTSTKPSGRKSYKDISQEVVQFDGITRMSTADSVSHFEHILTRLDLKEGKPMEEKELTRVAAAVLEFVYRRRESYFQTRTAPKPIDLEVLESFQETYRIRAMQKIKDFAVSLQQLESQGYAKILSRALGFTMGKDLYFLPKLILELRKICKEFQWSSGGMIQAKDVVGFLETWFKSDPHSGSLIAHEISLLHPPAVFFTYYIQQKMVQSCTSPNELFNEMDEADKQHLSVDLFAERLRKRFDIIAKDEDLTAIGCTIDTTDSGSIFRTEFLPLFSKKANVRDLTVVEVVEAIEKGYEEMQGEQAMELYQFFSEESGEDYRVSVDEVDGLMRKVRPGLNAVMIRSLVSRMKLPHSSYFSFEDFREFVLRFNLKSSGNSFFSQPEFDREQFDIPEDVIDLVASLS